MGKGKKVIIFFIIPVTVMLLLAGGVFSHKIQPGQTALGEAPTVSGVKLMRIQGGQVTTRIRVPGTVVAEEEATVSGKLLASVKTILVKNGDWVQQGEPLLLLDPAQVNAQANQAQANVKLAEAARAGANEAIRLAQTGVEQARAQVAQANASLQDAQAQYDNAKVNYERMTNLWRSGAASKQQLDNAATAYQSAQAAVKKAQAGVSSAQSSLNQAQAQVEMAIKKKEEADAQVLQSSAGYQLANIQVQDATIRAPFTGRFIETLVDEGDMASPGTPLLKMEKAPYYLEVYVDESKQNSIHVGDSIPVTIQAIKGSFTGKVAEITPHVDTASRTFKIKISLPNIAGIASGMFGEALIPEGKGQSIVIPQSAIVHWSQFTGVYVVDDQHVAHLRYVNLGSSDGQQVEVLSGLNAGDNIVVSPVDRVSDRAKVVAQP